MTDATGESEKKNPSYIPCCTLVYTLSEKAPESNDARIVATARTRDSDTDKSSAAVTCGCRPRTVAVSEKEVASDSERAAARILETVSEYATESVIVRDLAVARATESENDFVSVTDRTPDTLRARRSLTLAVSEAVLVFGTVRATESAKD